MPTTVTQPPTAGRRSRRATIGTGLLLLPALAGVYVGTVLLGPGIGPVSPVLLVVAAFFGYRFVVRSSRPGQVRAWVREVGAVVLGAVLATGVWVLSLVAGVLVEVIPFLSEGDHPYAHAWMVGWGVLAALSLPLWWSMLRRWADPEPG